MLQTAKLRDMYKKDAGLMTLVQGELRRSLKHSCSPTELHMKQCAKVRAGLSYEVTDENIKKKLKFMKQKK